MSDRTTAAALVAALSLLPMAFIYVPMFWDNPSSLPMLIAMALTFAAVFGLAYLLLSDRAVRFLGGRRED